jgi:hypothetical protein
VIVFGLFLLDLSNNELLLLELLVRGKAVLDALLFWPFWRDLKLFAGLHYFIINQSAMPRVLGDIR